MAIARVTLDLALQREFDYLIPPELEGLITVGTRVKVPFGSRQLLGCVTALPEVSTHPRLRPILRAVGHQALVTPRILELARWMADYYCCPLEIALKSVLPEAVRRYVQAHDGMLLANHGALTLGKDLFSAYYKMETIEHFAKISLVARLLGGERLLSREEVFRLQDLRGRYGIAAAHLP